MVRKLWRWLIGSKNEAIQSELLEAVPCCDRIQRLDLHPGDTVVMTSPGHLSVKAREDMCVWFREIMTERGISNVGLMILESGLTIETVLGDAAQTECHAN